MAIRNENRAAFDLSIPNNTEVDMVAPERETPGKIAMAWLMPMSNEAKKETSFSDFLALSAKNNNSPVAKKERSLPEGCLR